MESSVTYAIPVLVGLVFGELSILTTVVGYILAELLFGGEIPRPREQMVISALCLCGALAVGGVFVAGHLAGIDAVIEWLCCMWALLYAAIPFGTGYTATRNRVLMVLVYAALHASLFFTPP